jgi:hypothetical protein
MIPHSARRSCLALAAAVLAALPAAAAEPVDWEMVNRIRHEGLHHSEVMETARQLTDVIGPRLTGSPGLARANQWTRDQLAEWGLANAHLEPWGPFGRGWSFSRTAVHMLAPDAVPLPALPEAWTPGTDGPVRGTAMRLEVEKPEDLEDFEGKLAGKVLFLDEPAELDDEADGGPVVERYTPETLTELTAFEVPRDRIPEWRKRAKKRYELEKAMRPFLREQGAVATVEVSSRSGTLLRLGGSAAYREEIDPGVPGLVMGAEQYNRILRLLDHEVEVELEIDVAARFHDDDPMGYNTVAEIPGGDLADQMVMAGAHLDSWHPGTGATDNAAGCAMVMEAVRILQALGVHPRRTIRVALWTGEEQGLRGSRAYVEQHFASRAAPEDPEERALPEIFWENRGPLELKPEHARLAGYFNLDNGSGKVRGIYTQENAAVKPIFEAWLEPFHDLGADTVTLRNTTGTDHQSFDRVGLPGFQFIQDGLDYSARTHHTAADTYDHLRRDDLIQGSVVLASFLYHAAMRDQMLPREPLPRDDEEEKADRGDKPKQDRPAGDKPESEPEQPAPEPPAEGDPAPVPPAPEPPAAGHGH